jgi:hypothetical protein
MAEFKFIVFLNPHEGRDDEFNAWYDTKTIPYALRLAGFTSAQRFTATRALGPQPRARYVALYEVEASSVEEAVEVATNGKNSHDISDVVDLSSAYNFALTPVTPVLDGDGAAASDAPVKLVTFVDPIEGRDDEFGDWCTNGHVLGALSVEGFRCGQRFRTGPSVVGGEPPARYAALYDLGGIAERSIASGFEVHAAIELASRQAHFLTPLGPKFHSVDDALAHAAAARA